MRKWGWGWDESGDGRGSLQRYGKRKRGGVSPQRVLLAVLQMWLRIYSDFKKNVPGIHISLIVKDGVSVKKSIEVGGVPMKSVLMDNGVAIPEEGAILKIIQ